MDPVIIAALIGAASTLAAALAGPMLRKLRRGRGKLSGTIDELVITVDRARAYEMLALLIPKATEIRLAGWSLLRTIDDHRHALKDFVDRGGTLRILLLDPTAEGTRLLDSAIAESDPISRRGLPRSGKVSEKIATADVSRVLNIAEEQGFMPSCRLSSWVHPFGLIMLDCDDRDESWTGVQIYPLHPDLRINKRLSFALRGENSTLWKVLREQFEILWSDQELVRSATESSNTTQGRR